MTSNRPIAPTVLAALTLLAGAVRAAVASPERPADPLPRASAAALGLSGPRLQHMNEFFKIESERHLAAGYVLMVARDGKLVDASAVGYRNLRSRAPMTLDTRFRIASMSKPITSVAVLMLYEQGLFQLDDPIARFLPEFAHPRVFTGLDSHGNVLTEPAKRGITIRDLLTHRSGLGYLPGFDMKTPLATIYGKMRPDADATLAANVRKIAAMPLYYQPGAGWRYSYADDVLGRLVEVVSGMPFAQFLREKIFTPLNMNSTGFYLPAADAPLLATMYRRDNDGGLRTSHADWLTDPTDAKVWPSGGGGLISTAGDYLRFAQMLANGGSLDGHQILSPVTVDLMTHNQVAPDALFDFFGPDSIGLGYGLGVGVEIDARHAPLAGMDGDYSWGGIFDTHWIVSPATGLVAVLMTQIDPTVAPAGNPTPSHTDADLRTLLFASVKSLAPPIRR
ncbi:MAG: beta-lactamase family protein [Gammaproteobacteria bacterium]|nr:beta-lactamase family protein [Gammaproteobacteria bacterium]